MKTGIGVIFCTILLSFSLSQAKKPKGRPLKKITSDKVTSATLPLEIYARAKEELPKNPEEAFKLYMQAQSYASFDESRVADETAHNALSVLDSVDGEQDKFKKVFTCLPTKTQSVYTWVYNWARKAKPPTYYPKWMIDHGSVKQRAILSKSAISTPELVANFNAGKSWDIQIERLRKLVYETDWLKLKAAEQPAAVKAQFDKLIASIGDPAVLSQLTKTKEEVDRQVSSIYKEYMTQRGDSEMKYCRTIDKIQNYLESIKR